MSFTVVQLPSLEEALPHWTDLVETDLCSTFFSRPEWLLPWWKHHSAGREALTLAVQVDNHVAALGLFQVEVATPYLGGKRVSFLGSGLSDYADIIVNEALVSRRTAVRTMLEWLVGRFPRAVFDLQQIPETSPSLSSIHTWLVDKGLAETTLCQDVCPVASLPDEGALLCRQLKKDFVADVRRGDRRLRERGTVSIVDDIRPSDGDWTAIRHELAALQSQRMISKGEVPMWAGPLGPFVQDVMASADRSGSLRLTGLYLNERLIAYELCFLHRDTIYAWSRAFEEAYRNCGPGKIALLHLLETGISQGYRTFDLLRGEEPYKTQWTNGVVRNYRVMFTLRPSLAAYVWYRYSSDWKQRLQRATLLKKVYRTLKNLRGGTR